MTEEEICEEIRKAAANVVDMFDQANTGNAIENLGSRGRLLKEAIRILRRALNRDSQQTALSEEQAK